MAVNLPYKRLIKIMLGTSPVLAVYNIIPISFFINSKLIRPDFIPPPQMSTQIGIFLPITFITFNILIYWALNIFLVRYYEIKSLKSKFSRYIISFIIVLSFALLLHHLSTGIGTFPNELGYLKYYPFIGIGASNALILVLIDLTLLQHKKSQLEIEKARLEVLNTETRHELLKQQIQPHFLFNSLNTLKLLIKKNPFGAESFISRLSRFLRLTLSEVYEEKISVDKDLSIMIDYLEMQKNRFPDSINYTISIPNLIMKSYLIPAFTFQTLAENAVKHNIFDKNTPLTISISEENGLIIFINNTFKKNLVNSTGIGLRNLNERFMILSGRGISIRQTENNFNVKFNLMLS